MKNITLVVLAAGLFFGTAATTPTAEEHYRAGLANLKQDKFVEAIGHFTEAVGLDPRYADAFYQRSKAKELLARHKGYMDNEHYVDLLQAMRLGKPEALADIREGYAGECVAGLQATLRADEVYCLDLAGGSLRQVPAQLAQMANLVQLSLSDNQLTSIDAVLARNQTLISLDARRNQIESLPADIANLAYLQELNLRDNQLTRLPAEIARLKHLRTLNLAGNPIADLEKDRIREWLPQCNVYFGENEAIAGKARGNAKFRPAHKATDRQASGKAPKRF